MLFESPELTLYRQPFVHFDEGRFKEAEEDCTEAISLDDRYTKAYARRGTARRELQKYLMAVEGETLVVH